MAEKPGELTGAGTEDNLGSKELAKSSVGETNESRSETAAISDDPDEIRGQIEETRRGMGETLDAIQEKLSISNISEQVKEQVTEQITGAVETLKTTVADATIGKAGAFMKNLSQELKKANIGKIASENPLPLVLIGLGIGLLAISKYRKKSSAGYEKYRYQPNQPSANKDQPAPHKLSDKKGISQSIGDSANAAYEGVSGAAGSAYETVRGTAGDAYEKVGNLGGQLKNQYKDHLEDNPLVIGAIALAVGAVVGAAIPSTRYESELMGEARENLVAKAGDAARGAYEKAQEILGEAKETITEEVKAQISAQK